MGLNFPPPPPEPPTVTGNDTDADAGTGGELDEPAEEVQVVIEQRGPTDLILIETPQGSVQLATAPSQIAGTAVQAIFGTFERGNSPLARAFADSLAGGSGTPIGQAFVAALANEQVRNAITQAVGEGRTLYYFDGSSWQSFDPESLDAFTGQTASAAPADDAAGGTAVTAIDEPAANAPADEVPWGAGSERALAQALLGAGQLAALDGVSGGMLGDASAGHGEFARGGADSFQRQLAAAASGFERESAALASAFARRAG